MQQVLHWAAKGLSMLWKPIERNAAFFVFMFALGYLCTQLEVSLARKDAVPYELAAPELFFDIYLLCCLLAPLPVGWRRGLRDVLYVVFYGMALVDMYCYVQLRSTFTPTMLLLVRETDGSEASEFLRTYLSWDLLGSYVGWVLLLLLVHVAWAGVRTWRKWHVKRLSLAATAALGVLAGGLFVYSSTLCWENKVALRRMFSYRNVGDVEREIAGRHAANMYLPAYRLAFSAFVNHLASRQIDVLRRAVSQAQVDGCIPRNGQIVLIIGESYNRQHAQLYGYEMPTTPRQSAWEQRGNLVKFTDVVAPWNLTSYMFKYLFSMYSVGDAGDWCDQPLFPVLFRQAGYRVNFVTNQFLPQAGEAVFDFSGGFFLNDPQLSRLMFDHRNSRLYRFDEGVLTELDTLLADSAARPVLTILHLKGQHVDYRARYPKKTRSRFFRQDYGHRQLSERDKTVLADYDNATLYNDSVVDAVLRRFEQQDAVVIYLADHGDECFGDDLHVYGRLHTDDITPRLAREEYLIPFWVWCSDTYAARHPEVVEAVQRAAGRRYMSDRLPHMLLWLAGISSPSYQERLNVLAEGYDENTPRVLRGKWNYDSGAGGSE